MRDWFRAVLPYWQKHRTVRRYNNKIGSGIKNIHIAMHDPNPLLEKGRSVLKT